MKDVTIAWKRLILNIILRYNEMFEKKFWITCIQSRIVDHVKGVRNCSIAHSCKRTKRWFLQKKRWKMSAASRKLFKEMIAEAARMPDFNYRSYFLRWANRFWFFKQMSAGNLYSFQRGSPTTSQITLDIWNRYLPAMWIRLNIQEDQPQLQGGWRVQKRRGHPQVGSRFELIKSI